MFFQVLIYGVDECGGNGFINSVHARDGAIVGSAPFSLFRDQCCSSGGEPVRQLFLANQQSLGSVCHRLVYTVHPAVQRDKNAQTNNSQNKHVIRSHNARKDSHPVLHCVAPRAGLSQKNGDSLKFSSRVVFYDSNGHHGTGHFAGICEDMKMHMFHLTCIPCDRSGY